MLLGSMLMLQTPLDCVLKMMDFVLKMTDSAVTSSFGSIVSRSAKPMLPDFIFFEVLNIPPTIDLWLYKIVIFSQETVIISVQTQEIVIFRVKNARIREISCKKRKNP